MNNTHKEYIKNNPWVTTYRNIQQRCTNIKRWDYKYYGARNIKCKISSYELKQLWFRDKAYEMEKPSIDRIDNDGNYEFDNCRYIEHSENSRQSYNVSVSQYTLKNIFIKKWNNIKEASDILKICPTGISHVIHKNRRIAGGFKWKISN